MRGYKPDPVPAGTLETMIAAAQSAATSSNMQWTSVVVITDPEKKKKLAEWAGNQKHIEQCPLYLCWVTDMTRNALISKAEKCEFETMPWLETFWSPASTSPRHPERRGGGRVDRPQHRLYRRHAQ